MRVSLSRVIDRCVCRDCNREYRADLPKYRLGHWYSAVCYRESEVIDTECRRCGGEIETAYECAECGKLVAESATVFEGGAPYCKECRAVCPYCYEVVPSDKLMPSGEFTNSGRELLCCPECLKEDAGVA